MSAIEKLDPLPVVSIKPFSLASYAMKLDEAKEQVSMVREYALKILVEGVDYGSIPGTEKTDPKTGQVIEKRVLLKPGAEKLCQFFRLRPEFVGISVVENLETGLCFYRYRCDLTHIPTGFVVGCGIGSATSYHSKYRYRTANRKCPVCGKETIIKGKEEYGGGWLCFGKKGGCGAKFPDADPAIIDQQVGRVENENLWDVWNTVDKMAQKSALIAATLIVIGGSELFTQDLEDEPELPKTPPMPPPAPPAPKKEASKPTTPPSTATTKSEAPPAASENLVPMQSICKNLISQEAERDGKATRDDVATEAFGYTMRYSEVSQVKSREQLEKAIAYLRGRA